MYLSLQFVVNLDSSFVAAHLSVLNPHVLEHWGAQTMLNKLAYHQLNSLLTFHLFAYFVISLYRIVLVYHIRL